MITSFSSEGNDEEDHHEHWNGSMSRSQSKHPNQQASPLPTKLPAGAHIPSCAWPGTYNFSKNCCLVFCLHILFLTGMFFSSVTAKKYLLVEWLLTLIIFNNF